MIPPHLRRGIAHSSNGIFESTLSEEQRRVNRLGEVDVELGRKEGLGVVSDLEKTDGVQVDLRGILDPIAGACS